MAEQVAFKPLKEFGELTLSDHSTLKFYVDEYKGYRYASIRTFVTGDAYSGPTKSGVTMNGNLLKDAIIILAQLPAEPKDKTDRELARWPKRAGIEVVARVTIYKDTVGVDIREWVEDDTYKGWSKKGVRVPYKDIPKAIELLRQMQDFIGKTA